MRTRVHVRLNGSAEPEAAAGNSCRGLQRKYASMERTAPCNAANHLMPSGTRLFCWLAWRVEEPSLLLGLPLQHRPGDRCLSSRQPRGHEAATTQKHCHVLRSMLGHAKAFSSKAVSRLGALPTPTAEMV